MTKHSLLLSSVAALALSGGIAAADAHLDADGNPVVAVPDTATGGQIVVEQGDAEVDVTVEDPVVTVDQARPEVLVEQAQPQITVTVAEPTVNVEQQAPVITIEQAQPQVTVSIPEPTITVRMPEPDVNVQTSEPQIAVDQPEPIVRFVRPEPNITIEESRPQVNVTQAEPEVRVTGGEEAAVRVEQAEANVEIESEGDGNVLVSTEDPVVNIDQADEAAIAVDQPDANIVVEEVDTADIEIAEEAEVEADVTGLQATRIEGRSDYRAVFADATVADVLGMEVFGERGNDVGDVDSIIMTAEGPKAVVGVGGFLGLGEHNVALSMDRFTMTNNGLVLDALSEAELEGMPMWDEIGETQALDAKIIDLE